MALFTTKTQTEATWAEIKAKAQLGDKVTTTLKNGQELTFEVAAVDIYGGATALVCADCLPDITCPMNSSPTNAGGWLASDMRRFLREEIVPLLPEDLAEAIIPRVIYQSLAITETDLIWLPSYTEMFGGEGCSSDEEDDHFPLYDTDKSRVKECGENGTWFYWLRSPEPSNGTYFRIVSSNGTAHNFNALSGLGVAFGFLI
ncbi:MAG: DUF6273 domain-containing protein [Ruminococcus sp.]